MAKDRSGYIFQDKRGNWFARTTVKDSEGKRRNVKKRAKDKTDAKEILKSLLRRIEDEGAKVIEFSRLTFNDLAAYYEKNYLIEAQYVDGRKIAGLRSVDRPKLCVAHFRDFFGNKKLREITYGDIYSYRLLRLKTPTIRYNRTRSIADVNRELSVLRRMLNIAVREGWIIKNPFNCGDSLISVADERRRERILTLEEETRLLQACEHPQRKHLRSLLICLLDTGSRKGEMLKLRWKFVCFSSRIITIEGMTTKTLKTRQVAMTSRMYDELVKLHGTCDENPEGLVFGIKDNFRNSGSFLDFV